MILNRISQDWLKVPFCGGAPFKLKGWKQGVPPVGEGSFEPQLKPLDPKTTQGEPMATYAFATQAALVSLDLDSGEVEVLSFVGCHDVGRAINPSAVMGQIEGSISMGLGYSLMEEWC